jgi:hypothetical protein
MKTTVYTRFEETKDGTFRSYFVCPYCQHEDFWFVSQEKDLSYYFCTDVHHYSGRVKPSNEHKLVRVSNASPLSILAERFA